MTGAGRRLQPLAERIVNELRSLEPVIEGSETAVLLRLDVAATPMVSASLLPGVVRGFAGSHARVHVHLADVDVRATAATVVVAVTRKTTVFASPGLM